MEKILLVINGRVSDRKVVAYAVDLCLRTKASLEVLQILRIDNVADCLKKAKKKADHAKQLFEGSMVAATFAEAGEYEMAEALMAEALKNTHQLLSEHKKSGVPYKLTIKAGNPLKEIVNFVREHKNVVVTVFDSIATGNKENYDQKGLEFIKRLTELLPVPLVMVPAKD